MELLYVLWVTIGQDCFETCHFVKQILCEAQEDLKSRDVWKYLLGFRRGWKLEAAPGSWRSS